MARSSSTNLFLSSSDGTMLLSLPTMKTHTTVVEGGLAVSSLSNLVKRDLVLTDQSKF